MTEVKRLMQEKTKSEAEVLKERLFSEGKSSWPTYSIEEQKKVFLFCEGYKDFMRKGKTERECVSNIIEILKQSGFREIKEMQKIGPNDKGFKIHKGKALVAFVAGKSLDQFRIVGSHVDSPRLDLKPNPVEEDSDIALFQTHYYGGIKKYQWVNTPLALHGVVFTKDGKKLELNIGEKDTDTKFIISDLMPHLAKEQMEKKAEKVVEGEELKVVIGNMPIEGNDVKEKVKLAVLKRLNEEYGIVEEDFSFAELELVPAAAPTDIGFDRSMIASYAHDDRVCVYTSLMALLEISSPEHTAVCMFVDKEEIGSVGNTGAASFVLGNFAKDYAALISPKSNSARILENSKAISADVTGAMDPNHKDVSDPRNTSYLGRGVSIEKYGGGGGKYFTNDAHAEFMSHIRGILEESKIPWQTGELGKIDVGGGGTIAMFMSRYGMDCVDAGPCLLGMHAPYEIASKADIYSAHRLYKAFMQK